jgi:tRNA1(Val) A37 N6-methylase TrmN6
MMIIPKKGRTGRRYILQFIKDIPSGIYQHTLAILDETGHHTAEYKELTKEFYIDF